MSSYEELYLHYTKPVVRQNFGASLSHKIMYNLNLFPY